VTSAAAQTVDKPEPGSVEAIANATTEPRFLSPWVSYVPDSPDVPSPTDYLGHIVGAPGELTSTARIYGYYRALAAASPRVRVDTIGRSEEGREIQLVSIADERNLADRDRHRAAMADLADPRRIDGAKAEALITSTRPFARFRRFGRLEMRRLVNASLTPAAAIAHPPAGPRSAGREFHQDPARTASSRTAR
jgi:hypothetical protein